MNWILFRKHTVIQIPALGCNTYELLYMPGGFLTSVAISCQKGVRDAHLQTQLLPESFKVGDFLPCYVGFGFVLLNQDRW